MNNNNYEFEVELYVKGIVTKVRTFKTSQAQRDFLQRMIGAIGYINEFSPAPDFDAEDINYEVVLRANTIDGSDFVELTDYYHNKINFNEVINNLIDYFDVISG